MSEPVKDGGELDEPEKTNGEFVVAGGDSPVAFDSAKEIFDSMAASVITEVEGMTPSAPSLGTDTSTSAVLLQNAVKGIRVETSISHDLESLQVGQKRANRLEVVALAGGKAQADRSSMGVDHCRQLRIHTAFGAAHRLGGLPTGGIRTVLMKFDMGTIKVPQSPGGLLGEHGEQLRPKSDGAPTSPARVDRTPGAELCGHVPPRTARAQYIPDRRDHQPIILWRAATEAPISRVRLSRPITLIFLAEATMAPAAQAGV